MEAEVATVLLAVPEFAERYLDLVEAADAEPGTPATMAELAEFASTLVGDLARHRDVLVRLLGAVEEVAAFSPDAEEHIGWAFLESLSPEEVACLRPWLGPWTNALADDLDTSPDHTRGTG